MCLGWRKSYFSSKIFLSCHKSGDKNDLARQVFEEKKVEQNRPTIVILAMFDDFLQAPTNSSNVFAGIIAQYYYSSSDSIHNRADSIFPQRYERLDLKTSLTSENDLGLEIFLHLEDFFENIYFLSVQSIFSMVNFKT